MVANRTDRTPKKEGKPSDPVVLFSSYDAHDNGRLGNLNSSLHSRRRFLVNPDKGSQPHASGD